MSPEKVLGITKSGIENKPYCNDIMSIMCTFGPSTTGCTSDDRVASEIIKENKLYEEQLRNLGCSVSEYNAETDIVEIYKIMKAIDTVIDIPTLVVVEWGSTGQN